MDATSSTPGPSDGAARSGDAPTEAGSGEHEATLVDDEPRRSKAVAAGTVRPQPRTPATRRREAVDLDLVNSVVLAVASLAAIGAVFADAHPLEWAPGDKVLTAAFAAAVTLAASKSRRWTWLVLAGIAGITAREPATMALAALAVGLAFAGATLADRRGRALGALIGALSVQVLLRQPSFRYEGLSAAVATVAVLPVLVSGYRMCRRRTRRSLRRIGFVTAGFALAAAAGFALTAFQARSQMQTAVSEGRAGLDALRSGDQEVARAHLDRAREAFAAANASFGGVLARPARALPVVGVHQRAARSMSAAGEDLMSSASTAATSARYEDLKTDAGQVNLALLQSMDAPVSAAAESLRRAEAELAAAESSWLLPPLADPLREFRDEVREARPDADLAAEAVRTVPGLLGASGPRRYLLAFGTPSESRYLGGFIGSYGELTAVDGKLSLTRSGSIEELSNHAGAERRTLTGMSAYLDRYGRFQPARFLQNDSASPDFPTVAEALRQLYPQAGGSPIDGVIYVDPYGLAALLKVTGAVEVEGLDEPLTHLNAADFLLKQQYIDYPEANGVRSDLLGRVTAATFDALTRRKLPGPRAIADALGPMVDQRRVMMTTFDDGSRPLLERVGARGAFPETRPGADFFSFRTSNGGGNKIDAYLHRAYAYDVTYAPDTGAADVRVTVTLRNDAPPAGLPDYVIGNAPSLRDQPGHPKGTNVLDYSLYSREELVDASQDGRLVGMQSQLEHGHHVYSNRVTIAPGATTTLVFHLRGVIDAGTYVLDVTPQPGVGRDELSVAVRQADGSAFRVESAAGWPAPGGAPAPDDTTVGGDRPAVPLSGDQRFEVRFVPG